jgi:multiple sugar transport system permease protein
MLESQKLYPITLGHFNWNASVNQQPDLHQTIITGSFVPVVTLIVLFLLLQRFWKRGSAAGSIR